MTIAIAGANSPHYSAFPINKANRPGLQEQPYDRSSPDQTDPTEKKDMNRAVVNLIAVVERSEEGFADVPPGAINDEIEIELAQFGYAIALSDRLWIGGHRIHTPESIQAGNYRPYVPASIFTCVPSRFAEVPDARDFNLDAILEERGELRSN